MKEFKTYKISALPAAPAPVGRPPSYHSSRGPCVCVCLHPGFRQAAKHLSPPQPTGCDCQISAVAHMLVQLHRAGGVQASLTWQAT